MTDLESNLRFAQAYWVARDTLLWRRAAEPTWRYVLHHARAGGLALAPEGVAGGATTTLAPKPTPAAAQARFPHLAQLPALHIDLAPEGLDAILSGEVCVAAYRPDGSLAEATALQIAGVLDDCYAYDGPLGIEWQGETPTLRVWAPTAQQVRLHLFADQRPETEASTLPMRRGERGVWEIAGEPRWKGMYYLYEVSVFVRGTGAVELNMVTDPYSISLSMNSRRSQIVDLADAAHKPQLWGSMAKPPLASFTDSTIYELHVRDFSMCDPLVRPEYRGTYMAFTEGESFGMRHLRALAEAGLTHIHLLPVFDIASIEEDASKRAEPDPAYLAALPPDAQDQARLVVVHRERSGFNWGYDPYHYTTPEGSYATEPDGPHRIYEFRSMVQSLSESGLRVVMDVVYNHTDASGQHPKSVLDRIVPGYYHRLNKNGFVERSTCCQNTASEHAMMEKLIIDSVLTWARQYRVDGFRFDLMGHHMKANMVRLRAALDALTPERDGVDGRRIYLYGEGWDFGEVAGNSLGVNASQHNMGGTGIGSFNDRLRDAVRGGWPFDSGVDLIRAQGFATGLYTAPNGHNSGSDEERERLLRYQDWICLGMAGNLARYPLATHDGSTRLGADVDYNGQPAGYAQDPHEQVIYVEAHDNQTLFDIIQYKAPGDLPMDERVRMQNLANAIVLLSQGVPFLHAGQDMLRSKSLDRNSYSSGDWFNRLDFTYTTNGWGGGIPPVEHPGDLILQQRLLADPALRPAPEHIAFAVGFARELLRIRATTPLLRLPDAEHILRMVRFHPCPEAPGLIVMSIKDSPDAPLDPRFALVVVAINAAPGAQPLPPSTPQLAALRPHPIQRGSVDPRLRAIAQHGEVERIPGRSAAVLVVER